MYKYLNFKRYKLLLLFLYQFVFPRYYKRQINKLLNETERKNSQEKKYKESLVRCWRLNIVKGVCAW